MTTLSQRDAKSVWHPFTQHQTAPLPIAIARGEGAYLFDQQGKPYLDLVSSWWVNIHGHGHPQLAKAIYDQALQLEHVIFAGFTHEPAVALAETLLEILPAGFSKVFYSDNGSTSVEVALKMAYQYWHNQGQKQRTRFLAFAGGYHGDTFGAMAVGQSSNYSNIFANLLFSVDMAPFPATWMNDADIEQKEQAALLWLQTYLEDHGSEVAGMIIEPLVQGASGMHMCRPEFMQKIEKLLRKAKILIIYDEVMTGFGRTGSLFACEKSQTLPDIICLSKGLTGGFLPLAVTICQEHIYEVFLNKSIDHALTHGHSYTANPLGCRVALESIALLRSPQVQKQIAELTATHAELLPNLAAQPFVEKPRLCGTIAAFDLRMPNAYASTDSLKLREVFLERGLLIRPLGNVIYLLPPYCISTADLQRTYADMISIIQKIGEKEAV